MICYILNIGRGSPSLAYLSNIGKVEVAVILFGLDSSIVVIVVRICTDAITVEVKMLIGECIHSIGF